MSANISIRYALDLNKVYARYTHGDITVFATWIRLEHNFEPCLVLVPTHRLGKERVTPCVVHVDDCWLWSPEVGDGAYCARMAAEFRELLGLSEDPRNLIRIAMLIQEHLGDLLHIPPRPQERVAVADILFSQNEGRTVEHREVTENV